MKTKQRRRKRRIAPAGLMLISIIALGGVWFADAVRRAVETPSGNVEWTTEPTNASETPTEPPATTQPPTKAPLLPEATESVQIQDAATDLFEKPKDPATRWLHRTNPAFTTADSCSLTRTIPTPVPSVS